MVAVSSSAILLNIRAILLCFCIAAACTGLAGRQIVSRNDWETYVTLWESKAGGVVTHIRDIDCFVARQRIWGAAGCEIVNICAYFLMLLLCIADLIVKPNRITFAIHSFLSLIAFVFGLVAWALVAAMYHQNWCGGFTPANDDYKFAYGFILITTVWCTHILYEFLRICALFACPAEDDAAEEENAEEGEEMEEEDSIAREKRREAKRARHAARRNQQQQNGNAPDVDYNAPDTQ